MRSRRKLLFALVAAGAVLAFLRLFFFGVYQVDSVSMQPTIHGDPDSGERVLVRYGAREPERYDLVVVRVPGESVPRVKRVVGLPGEGVRIEHGDPYIDGERLPTGAPRPEPVLIYDGRLPLADYFQSREGAGIRGWTPVGKAWRHDGAPELPIARLEYARRLADHALTADGRFLEGATEVGDLWIGTALVLEDGTSRARLGVAAQGDRFLAWIGAETNGTRRVQLLSVPILEAGSETGESERLAEVELTLEAGRHEWVLGRVDGRVELWCDGRRILEHGFEVPRRHPLDLFGEGRSHGPRAWLEVGGGGVVLEDLALWRDLHYTSRGEYAVREELQLGPDELFLLGDHSARSRDGRDWGPTPLADLFGRPIAVVGPLADARRLEGAVEWVPALPRTGFQAP